MTPLADNLGTYRYDLYYINYRPDKRLPHIRKEEVVSVFRFYWLWLSQPRRWDHLKKFHVLREKDNYKK